MENVAKARRRAATALSLGLLAGWPGGAEAKRPAPGYTFQVIHFLGDPAPGGGELINDFEPATVNNNGDLLYGADVAEGEGIFLRARGQELPIARSSEPAPGGGIFGSGFLGPAALNNADDAAYAFFLDPFTLPVGVNAGVYRFSHVTHQSTAVVVPGVTPVPGVGGTFVGASFSPSLNDSGDLVFPGITETEEGIHLADEPPTGLGIGIYQSDRRGTITPLVVPGDPAPDPPGSTFDFATAPWVNDRGDVAFSAHVAGEECRAEGASPQAMIINCLHGVYLRKAATGQILPIALAGDPAPGGGPTDTFREAGSPVMNSHDDIVFQGDLTPPPGSLQVIGVYLYTGGTILRVAGPGDDMPGGGHFVTASTITGSEIHVNNSREVVFNAVLDEDRDGDGTLDTGLYVWSKGELGLVARSGTVIPGVGTVKQLVMAESVFPPPTILIPNSGAVNDERGHVLFGATLTDLRGVLLLATPKPR